jgi:hypothetical protein
MLPLLACYRFIFSLAGVLNGHSVPFILFPVHMPEMNTLSITVFSLLLISAAIFFSAGFLMACREAWCLSYPLPAMPGMQKADWIRPCFSGIPS